MPWKTFGLKLAWSNHYSEEKRTLTKTPTRPPSHCPQGQQKQSSFLTLAWQPLILSEMTIHHQWHLWPRMEQILQLPVEAKGSWGGRAWLPHLGLCAIWEENKTLKSSLWLPGPGREWGSPGRQDAPFCYAKEVQEELFEHVRPWGA